VFVCAQPAAPHGPAAAADKRAAARPLLPLLAQVLILRGNRFEGEVDFRDCQQLLMLDLTVRARPQSGVAATSGGGGVRAHTSHHVQPTCQRPTLLLPARVVPWFVALRRAQDNFLWGSLPLGITNQQVFSFRATNNRFNGSIPEDIWQLPVLTTLDLGNNDLSGTISPLCGSTYNLVNVLLGALFFGGRGVRQQGAGAQVQAQAHAHASARTRSAGGCACTPVAGWHDN
jgi:hypothetical protein